MNLNCRKTSTWDERWNKRTTTCYNIEPEHPSKKWRKDENIEKEEKNKYNSNEKFINFLS